MTHGVREIIQINTCDNQYNTLAKLQNAIEIKNRLKNFYNLELNTARKYNKVFELEKLWAPMLIIYPE